MACPTRRCAVCRTSFRPDRRASKTQKVCSAACRVAWRTELAAARRAADREGFRAADQARQAAWRAARGEATAPIATVPRGPPPARPVSRAGFGTQAREVATQIVEKLAEAAAVSRAGFERELSKIVEESVEKLAKACA